MLTKEVIEQFPKVELHCHLDGSIRPKTLMNIALAQNIRVPKDWNDFLALIQVDENCNSLADYLKCFNFTISCLQTATALQTAAYDVMEQAALDGVSYIELRFAPTLSTKKDLSVFSAIIAVIEGMERAKKDYSISGNLLLCGMRSDEKQLISQVLTASGRFKNHGVCGFDLAGPEIDYQPNNFANILETAAKENINVTLHAGECHCPHNIIEAISLGAKRIGHGVAMANTPDIIKHCVEQDILIEICPTSNVQTQAVSCLQDHPFRLFKNNGVKMNINTDNRTVSNTTLTKEYLLLAQNFNLTLDELAELNINGITYSFANEKIKATIKSRIDEAYRKFSKEHSDEEQN